ncbi:MAG: hypothetical protein WCQ65_12380 [Fermentimonas sp.]
MKFRTTLSTKQIKVILRCTLGLPLLKNQGETILGMQANSTPGNRTSIIEVALAYAAEYTKGISRLPGMAIRHKAKQMLQLMRVVRAKSCFPLSSSGKLYNLPVKAVLMEIGSKNSNSAMVTAIV